MQQTWFNNLREAKGYQDNILPCRLLLFGFAREIEDLIISIIPNTIINICISYTFQQLEVLVTDYDILVRNLHNNYNDKVNNNQTVQRLQEQIKLLLSKIRSSVLLNGVPDNYALSIDDNDINNNNNNDNKITFHNDTLRGKLYCVMLGLSSIKMDINKYQSNMHENNCNYTRIRDDTKRTFLTSSMYRSRVKEAQLSRLLNVYVNINKVQFLQCWDSYAAILLYSMPELYAYYALEILIKKQILTYVYRDSTRKYDIVGAYAGSYLSWYVLKIIDKDLFNHLKLLPPNTYMFPPTACLHTLCQPFDEMIKLWDFMICFGMHLSPIITVAEIISFKHEILQRNHETLLRDILSQRKYLNQRLNANKVIEIAMDIICTLKENDKYEILWNKILNHASNLNIASEIRRNHESGEKKQFMHI